MKFKSKFIDDTQLDQATLLILPHMISPIWTQLTISLDNIYSLLEPYHMKPYWKNMTFMIPHIKIASKSYLDRHAEPKFI